MQRYKWAIFQMRKDKEPHRDSWSKCVKVHIRHRSPELSELQLNIRCQHCRLKLCYENGMQVSFFYLCNPNGLHVRRIGLTFSHRIDMWQAQKLGRSEKLTFKKRKKFTKRKNEINDYKLRLQIPWEHCLQLRKTFKIFFQRLRIGLHTYAIWKV